MDDLQSGTRDKRGDWSPNKPLETGPLLAFPPNLIKILKWLPGYLFPWTTVIGALGVVFWLYLTPDIDTLKTLSPGWILYLLARNSIAVFLFYGAFELRLYIKRSQGSQYKYNSKWPSEHPSDVFMFRSQAIDSIIRTFGTGVPIWTAYEVVILWVFANGWVPWLSWSHNFVYLALFSLLLPLIHEVHFYFVHRLIHVPILYKWIHSVHHNSVNPSPWSSLAMHPIEHLLYFSGALIHLIVPSNPLLAIWHLHQAGFGAVIGHIGFEKIVAHEKSNVAIDTHTYAHYLHHKYFEVNYADGAIPLDRWFGTWHDGTSESDQQMNARMKKRRERAAARK